MHCIDLELQVIDVLIQKLQLQIELLLEELRFRHCLLLEDVLLLVDQNL